MTESLEEQDHDIRAPYRPPRWTIDLSLPPTDRYRKLARHYKDRVQDLTGLFDALLGDIAIPSKWIPTVNRLSRLVLRRVHDNTQTEELRGISEESGVPMYLLVAFNVILDLLMGCTSGGVRTLEKGRSFSEAKMLHFRTLDWTMDPLRKVVVQLDFVRSESSNPNQILASSITYVGFTGVLTGVRPGLSMSLNFRGLHDGSSRTAQFRFYFHHLLVLLGQRPSIATYLRRFLTGDHEDIEASSRNDRASAKGEVEVDQPMALTSVFSALEASHTTAAYLIFNDGQTTMSIDKDFSTATMRQSNDFIVTTNHDVIEHNGEQKENLVAAKAVQSAARNVAGFQEFLDESVDRHACISKKWKRLVAQKKREAARKGDVRSLEEIAAVTTITEKKAIEWTSAYSTTNECTHYAVLMDPKQGRIAWCLAYPES